MGFKKFFCTCVGCVVGAACIALTGGAATPLVATALIGGAGAAGYFYGDKKEKDEKKLKNQEKDLELKGETIKSLKQDIEKLQTERNKKQNEHENQETENKKLEQQFKEAKNKSNDSNLSSEERSRWATEAMELEERLNQGKDKSKSLLNEIKSIDKQISNNNKNISSIGSSSFGKDKGIWEFITLENVLIVVVVYALYQIAIKDK